MGSMNNNVPSMPVGHGTNIFDPQKPDQALCSFTAADDLWLPMIQSHCTFEPDIFLGVMQNLIKNPNIMSTHLFRADVLYDSRNDHSIITQPGVTDFSEYTKHMKKECRPVYAQVPGYEWQQTYVRQLVPRNRQLDEDMLQTCHFLVKRSEATISHLILYIPHVLAPETMPWYHPKVQKLAFLHESKVSGAGQSVSGSLSVHFCPFPDYPMDQRLERTALQLLTKIHKHSRGQQGGYVKRVHHDRIVPQQTFQDTYARLKAKYAKNILDNWAEKTDPSKHIFEDLGIAAFLIEVWAVMYNCDKQIEAEQQGSASTKPRFPGFVDIGCGNGLLVSVLEQEGYLGWGFDARRRKTWRTFTTQVQKNVKELVLVPKIINDNSGNVSHTKGLDDEQEKFQDHFFHNGVFEPIAGTGTSEPPFIISNHADELTPWTPLLAYLNGSSFIAIPCCSHNLAGARWRAPTPKQTAEKSDAPVAKPQVTAKDQHPDQMREQQAAETGSLKRPVKAKGPSAYASLCDYVTALAAEVGFTVEKEMLRIPSTRNACLLGRYAKPADVDATSSEAARVKTEHVRTILVRELGTSLDAIGAEWVMRARQIAGKKADGH